MARRKDRAADTTASVSTVEPPKRQDAGGKFTWRDEKLVCTVEVSCPKGTKAKDVCCEITEERIRIEVSTLEEPQVMDGPLFAAVNTAESMWSLEDAAEGGRAVVVELTKQKEMRWLAVTR